jgi:MFS-type transporter involved in bile tolerance (Atg22 family)
MTKRRVFVDVTPLRESRDFRLIWIAQLTSNFGRQMVIVAVAYQVFLVTHSSLAVGLVGLFQAVPVIAAGLYGGALADRYDRPRMQLASKMCVAAGSVLLAVGASGFRAPLWSIYLIVALTAGATILDLSAQRAMLPQLVRNESLPAALALSAILSQAAAIMGPALAGLILARAGLTWAYAADALGFLPAAGLISRVSGQPRRGEQQVMLGWGAPKGVLGYLRKDRLLIGVFFADLVAMIFGMPTAVFPQLALRTYGIGVGGLGLLYAAPAAGALLGSVFSGWIGRIRRQGVAVLTAIAIWGAAIVGFGLAGTHLWGAILLLAVAGSADLVSEIFRNTIIQLSVPDSMRGRMSAFAGMVATVGPSMGDLRAGAAASIIGPIAAVVSGGVACIVGVSILGLSLPELRRQRAGSVESEGQL